MESRPAQEQLTPRPWIVEEVTRESHDVATLHLSPLHEPKNFSFLPGQFNMIHSFPRGEVPISSAGIDEKGRLLHTIRAVGKITDALTSSRPGDQLGMRGPYGSAWPMAKAMGGDVIFVAGGIGLAPLRHAISEVLKRRQDYGQVAILYGARTPEDQIFTDFRKLLCKRADVQFFESVDHAPRDYRGAVGVVTTFWDQLVFDPEKSTVMTCGPEVMMRHVADDLIFRDVSPENIYMSMERNMKCAAGSCGRCLFGPHFVCRDGPVFACQRLLPFLTVREL